MDGGVCCRDHRRSQPNSVAAAGPFVIKSQDIVFDKLIKVSSLKILYSILNIQQMTDAIKSHLPFKATIFKKLRVVSLFTTI